MSSTQAQFTFNESFTGTTAVGWNFVTGGEGAGPSLTAFTGVDTAGDGWLRLGNNTNNQANAVWLDTAIPSSSNTIQVSFDIAMYGNATNPGDGIGFFLWDASTTFSVGADGGSFGYAQKTTHAGMSNGYVGIALDVYGNYSSASEGRVGGLGTGLFPDTVGVRGSSTTNYDYIANELNGGNTQTEYSLDFANLTTRPDQSTQYRHVRITLSADNILTVEIQYGESGIWVTEFQANITDLGLRPEQLRLGFSSSTGGATEYYELRNLAITATDPGNAFYWDNTSANSIWNASNPTNWRPDITPTDRATVVFTDTYINSNQNINMTVTRTVGSALFSGSYSYSISGAGTLIFDTGVSTVASTLSVTDNGNSTADHSINVPIVLHNNLNIDNYTPHLLTISGTMNLGAHNMTNRGNGATLITGVISGTGGVTENGDDGILVLAGNNTYTGLTTVSAGTLIAASSTALGGTANGTAVHSGGTLALYNTGTVTNETLALNGDGDNGQGALRNMGGNNTWTGRVTLSTSSSLAADAGTVLTISASVSGNTGAGINKIGDGTIVLSNAANSYTGATTFTGGILQIANNSNLGTVPASAAAGVGNLTFNGGTLAVTGTTTISPNRGILLQTNSGTINVAAAQTVTYGGIATGNGGLTKDGSGTLILTGVNTYTGSTTISGGTLSLANAGNNALDNNSRVTLANVAGATLLLSNSETIGSLAGGGAAGGDVNLNGRVLTVGGDNTSTDFGGDLTGGAGSGLVKTGTGTMTLSGTANTSTFTGATTISGGVLALGGDNVLSNNSSVILNGGTLTVNGHTDTAGALGLTANSTIDFGNLTSQLTFSSNLAPTGGALLAIDNWSGSILGGSGSQLFIGDSAGDATAAMLAQIQFEGFGVGATQLATGEIVPYVASAGRYWDDVDASGNWSTNGNWNPSGEPNGVGSLAVFGTITSSGTANTNLAKTVNVNNTFTVGYMVFNSPDANNLEDFTLADAGGRIIFNVTNGSAIINMTTAQDATISALVSLSDSLVIAQNGSGLLTIGGSITTGGNDITVGGPGNTAISGNFGGTGTSVTKNGTGTLTLSGTNSYSGGTVINDGIISISADANLGSATGRVITFDGGTLAVSTGTFNLTGNVTLNAGGGTIDIQSAVSVVTSSGIYSGVGGLTKTGSGTLVLAGNNTYTGTTTVGAGTLALSGGNAIANTGAVVIAASPTATLSVLTAETIGSLSGGGNVNLGAVLTTGANNASTTYDGVITGTSGLVKTGTGTFLLTNTNSYAGATTVSGGILAINNGGALGTNAGGTIVASGGTLDISNNITVTGETLTLSGTGSSGQGALNNSGGTNTWAGNIASVGGSTIGITTGSLTVTGSVTNTTSLTVAATGSGVFTGVISGAGTFTKDGTGTVTLSGVNTYTGATTVSNGILAITTNSALGTGAAGTTITNGGTLALSNNITVTGEALNLVGTGFNGGGTILSTGNNMWTGTVSLLLAPSFNVVSGTLTMSGAMSSGTGTLSSGLSKDGDGTLVLSGNNNYSGAVSVNDGILVVASANALGTTSTSVRTSVYDGASLQLATTNTSFAESFTINGTGVGNAGALQNIASSNTITGLITLGSDASIGVTTGTTLSATNVIDGAASLTKVGGGTLVLSATNTYTGSTHINGGTVVISNDNNLGAAPAVASANKLTFDGGTLMTSTSLTINSNRGITLNSGGGTINVANAATVTYGGVATGTGGLTKAGNGTLVLSGSNTYTGNTTITGGTLLLGASNVIANNSNVVMGAGSTLALNGHSDTVGTLTLTGNSTIDFGSLAGATTISFADSSASGWSGGILTITNYNWTLNNDYLYVGTNSSGLSSTNVGLIRFINPVGFDPGTYYAQILSDGRIVPIVPEPATIIGGALLLLLVVWRERARLRRWLRV